MATGQQRKSKLDPYLEKLGVVPDVEVAAMAGVTVDNVRAYRRRRGIQAGWRGAAQPLLDERAAPAASDVTAAPEPKKATKKRKPAKPKAKKAAAKTRRAKKPTAEPVVDAELAVAEDPVIELVVVAEPAPVPVPVVEAEPAEGLPPEPEPEPTPAPTPAPAPRVSSTRKPRKTKLDAYLDKVGLLSDKQVADLAGVTAQNVRTYRARRGIPARWRGEGEGETVAAVSTLVTRPSAKPAKGKVEAAGVGQARRGKLTPYLDQIGTVPDARIAELSGTTPANVRAFRLRHDIPAGWRGEGKPVSRAPSASAPVPSAVVAPTSGPAQAVREPRRGKLTPYLEEIGIVDDRVIAAKAGTTTQNVQVYRARHGIPARWKGEGEPLPNHEAVELPSGDPREVEAEATVGVVVERTTTTAQDEDLPPEFEGATLPVALTPAPLLEAYVVTVAGPDDEIEYVVVANGIAEAAARAVAAVARAGLAGKVIAVRFLAPMLGS